MKFLLILLGAIAFIVCDLLKPEQVVPTQPQAQDAHEGSCGYC